MKIPNIIKSLMFRQQKTAWHSLKKNIGFYMAIVATVSITVGTLLCVITLNDLLLRKPLPYPDQDKLVVVSSEISDQYGAKNSIYYSYPELIHLFTKQEELESAAIISYESLEVSSLPDQPSMYIAFTTPKYAKLFGMKMAVGSFIDDNIDINSRVPGAVISYSVWRDKFNFRSDILDQSITIRSVSHRIVGVTDKSFITPQISAVGLETQIWLPWDFNTTENGQRKSWTVMDGKYYFVGRLLSGSSVNQAQQRLSSVIIDKWKEGVVGNEFYRDWNLKIKVKPMQDVLLGDSRTVALMLLAGALGLMLIACVNISNLFILKAVEKQREFAIRAAVGARKADILNLFFAESVQLMCISIFFALGVAYLGFNIMQRYLYNLLPRVGELSVNLVTLSSAALIAIVLAYIFAKLSANAVDYLKLNTYLSSGKGTGAQVSAKTRSALIIVQVALAVFLILVNISLLQKAVFTITEDRGFDVSSTASLLMMTSEPSWPSRKDTFNAMEEFKRKILLYPEVSGFSRSSGPLVPPLSWGVTIPSTDQRFTPFTMEIDSEYFDLVEQSILFGRNLNQADIDDWNAFNFSDAEDMPGVIVVDESFAKKITNGNVSEALGKSVLYSEGWVKGVNFTVVGIVKDIKHRAANEERPTIYLPRFSAQTRSIIKYKPGQSLSREKIVNLITDIDKRYVVSLFDESNNLYYRLLFTQITTAVVTSILTALVFFLATIGLYGVLSYGTHLRRIELGTRMAIGAKRKDLISLIIMDNMKTFLIGLLAGCLLFAFAYIGFNKYIGFNIDMSLLPAIVLAFCLILFIVLFGCYWPLKLFIAKPINNSLRMVE